MSEIKPKEKEVISDLKPLIRLMNLLANSAATVLLYNDDGRMIRDDYDRMKEKYHFDLSKLSNNDLKVLGFGVWDEPDADNQCLYLIPMWFYHFLSEGTEITSIDGSKAIVGKDAIDLDARFGCLAWGLLRRETNG